ncbi:MAG: (Fe-S)-binding protein [Bacteroidales bacterium]|nr:(Fe-S)-binding protein [Bacteroidales bacterium]
MRERFLIGFDPFVLPFMLGMAFVLTYCIVGLIRVVLQLSKADRRKLAASLFKPANAWKNIRDMFCDCLFHVKLWKRNPKLGYMHSSIAFGWFMLIVLGHVETFVFVPKKAGLFYYPIFFRYFMEMDNYSLRGSFFFFAMDFFLLIVLSGILLAMFKRIRSRFFGMRRTTRLSITDRVGLYSLWAIFPLRWIAEGFTAGIAGGSFMTIPINMLLKNFMSNPENITVAWWLYSIALGTFMFALPFSRYMHIPAEILLIPMKNAGLKVYHPRKGFALAQIYTCPSCGVCIDACPMSASRQNLKDTTVYLVRQIKRNNARRMNAMTDKCLMCGKCQEVCQIALQSYDIRMRIRERATYNVGLKYDYLDSYQPELGKSKVLYYAGCMSSLTPVTGRSIKKLLDKAGVEWTQMDAGGGVCCGRPLILAGRRSEAAALIEKNTSVIESSGARILLVSCAICYRVFKEEYKLKGIRVMHYTEYFNEMMEEGRLKLSRSNLRYAYHDPCDLGRGCGIYDEPREALSRVGIIAPAEKERELSVCCGGSVGSLTLNFEDRKPITQASVQNMLFSNPDRIVTACPLCLNTFARYSPVKVVDFAEALCDGIEKEAVKEPEEVLEAVEL